MNTRIKSITAALAAVLAAATAAQAAESSAAQFLRLGFGARALGMGEAFTAVSDDAAALHYNPAGLAPGAGPEQKSAVFSHAWHIQDMGVSQAALLLRPWAFGLTYFSAGTLEGRDDSGAATGDFTARDLALSAGRGVNLGEFSAGAAVKYVGQEIDGVSAHAAAVDLGALYRPEGSRARFGAALTNFGTKIKFRDDAFPLPLTFRAGASVELQDAPVLLAAQADFPNDAGASLRLGAEYRAAENFRLRAGYKTSSSEDRDAILGKELGGDSSGVSSLFGFFAGIGLYLGDFTMDYALAPYGELGSAHRVTLAMKF